MSGPTEDGLFDLVVTGGTVVTSSGTATTDVGVVDGQVVQLGGVMSGLEVIDARGMLVLPGGVDMHVHLSPVELEGESVPWADDFDSGSRAAAAGGVTTIGNITFPRSGERLPDLVARVAAEAARDSIVDFVLHPVALEPSGTAVADVAVLAEQGHTSIKLFMSLGHFDAQAAEFVQVLAAAGRSGLLTMVHCEDACVIEAVTARLVAEGRTSLQHYGESRPELSEVVAVTRMIAMAAAAEAPIYIVHLGSAAALAEARAALGRGQQVYVETRPIYLHFTDAEFATEAAPLFVGNPPLRSLSDQQALWAGLAAGHVHTCCTDHAAWTKEQKLDPTLTVQNARPGMADLETLMPLLFSEGVRTGRLSVERFVEVTATNAAKLFGLYPRKGTIAVGSDADLVVWDPVRSRRIDDSRAQSRSGYSLYDGREVVGTPVATVSRGRVIFRDGQVVAEPGGGRLVPRGPTRPL